MPDLDTYTNPVISGFHPDPSICRVGNTFYLVTSSFEYFPGIPIFMSYDLVSWHQLGHCLTATSQLDLTSARSSQGVFAPTIRWHDGVFFVTGTNVSGGGHFIVHATDPAGPWSKPVWVDQSGIDPSLYFEDGITYFQSNIEPNPAGEHQAEPDFTRGIQQCEVNPFTGERLSASKLLWTGSGGQYPEAPHLYKRGDYYYLLIAEGGTERGHMVTVARSSSVWGPFIGCDRNPILSHRSTSSTIQSTGHADLVELEDGSWWGVLLGTRPVKNWHHLGRETFLIPVTWDDDEWPVLGAEGKVPLTHPRPTLTPHPFPVEPTREEFEGTVLAPMWNSLRTPLAGEVSLQAPSGTLVMRGSGATTSDENCVFLGRRQQWLDCSVAASLDPESIKMGPNGIEVGLMVRMDEHHHFELAVSERADIRRLVYRQRIGDLVNETELACPRGSLELRIHCEAHSYTFSAHGQDEVVTADPPAKTRYISSEVAGGFTGAYIGLYITGVDASASWNWISFDQT